MIPPLRDCQIRAIEYGLKHPYSILALDPGLGKSRVAIEIRERRGEENCLIVAPSHLVANWKHQLDTWAPKGRIVTAVHRGKDIQDIFDSDYAVISYDLAQKAEQFFDWADIVVLDECFHEDTLVDTPEGEKKISEMVKGDKVLNCTGVDSVKSVSKTPVRNITTLIISGREIVCSSNHPIFTIRGWVPAGKLEVGELIVTTEYSMRILQDATGKENLSEEVLREILLSEMEDVPALHKGEGIFRRGPGQRRSQSKGNQEAGCLLEDENKKPNVQEIHEGEGIEYLKGTGLGAENPRRERVRAYSPGKEDTGDIPISPLELRNLSREEGRGIPHQLQGRSSDTEKETSHRSRWTVPQPDSEKSTRREENKKIKFLRVESVKSEKLGSSESPMYFYDLGISRHPSFSVNKVLVHNCHYCKSMAAKRTQFIHKNIYENSHKSLLMLTGTPIKNRVAEYYSILALSSYDPNTADSRFLKKFPTEIDFADHFSHRREYTMDIGNKRVRIVKWEGMKNVPELKTWLKGRYLRISGEHELPPISYKDVFVSDVSNPELEKAFNAFFSGEGKDEVNPTAKAEAALAKTAMTIKYVKDLLEEVDSVVIFTDHVQASENLAKAFDTVALNGKIAAKDRTRLAKEFQDGKGKVLVATIPALREGVDLVRAHHLVLSDYAWVPGDMKQVVHRIRRISQTKNCVVHRIIGSPQDEKIMNTLDEKMKVIDAVT